jgi:enoyl-CoA hydratase/carnithine racemase
VSNQYELIRIDRDAPVADIVLDNPDRLNAMSSGFFEEIRRACEELDADASINAVVLWAEGRLFTAGLDLTSVTGVFSSHSSEAVKNRGLYDLIRDWQDCMSAPEKCHKPVIAAVHGHCIGGGVDLTTACDIRLCTRDATFSIKETKLAMVADVGTLQRITGIVGKGMAREMAYTGKRIGAERALACGLVNQVFEDKQSLLDGARELAREIAANSPLAVQGTKTVLQYSERHGVEAGLEYVAQWNSSFLMSNDLMEAMSAFSEKRDPKFKGD